MHAHPLRPLRSRGNLCEAHIGGIGSQHDVFESSGIQGLENLTLEIHNLGNGLNNRISVLNRLSNINKGLDISQHRLFYQAARVILPKQDGGFRYIKNW